MAASLLSCAAILQASPRRNCFISLPKHWAKKIVPSSVHVFLLENSFGCHGYATWAGETHSDGFQLEEETVELSRVWLTLNGFTSGSSVSVRQVTVPAPCTCLSVAIDNIDDWDALVVNSDVVQLEFLNQVRLVYSGELIPLWLPGGVCITMRVLKIAPATACGLLLPLTYIEVMPPSAKNDIPLPPNTFTSVLPIYEHPTTDDAVTDSKEHFSLISDSGCNELLIALTKAVAFNLVQHHMTHGTSFNKTAAFSYRVTPMPKVTRDVKLPGGLINSVLIASRSSVEHSFYKNSIFFLAKAKFSPSPDKDETKNDKLTKKTNECINDDSVTGCYCMVLVWENFKRNNVSLDKILVNTFDRLIKGQYLLVPDALRRRHKLPPATRIWLQTEQFSLRSFPLVIDVYPITKVTSKNVCLISDAVKFEFCLQCELCDLVLNDRSLHQVKLGSGVVDVIVLLRDKTPLLLTRESAPLLNITVVNSIDNPIFLPRSTSLLDVLPISIPSNDFVGDPGLQTKMKSMLTRGLGLTKSRVSCPGFALVVGEAASGKTTLMQSVANQMAAHPHFVWVEMISCKSLLGKKADTIEKKFSAVLVRASLYKPSLILMDDLDVLCPISNENEGDSELLINHQRQLVTVVTGIIELAFQANQLAADDRKSCQVGNIFVLATCRSRDAVDDNIASMDKAFYFPNTFTISNIKPDARIRIFHQLLNKSFRHSQNFSEEQSSCPKLSNATEIILTASDARLLKLTEGYKLPDLDHLARRTVSLVLSSDISNDASERVNDAPSSWVARQLQELEQMDGARRTVVTTDDQVAAAAARYMPLAYKGEGPVHS